MREVALILWLLAAGITLPFRISHAHPYHTSLAEAEVNAASSKLEVALRLLPTDLEKALEHFTRKNITVSSNPRLDPMITQYLNQTFRVKIAGDQGKELPTLPLEWVGKEISVKAAWLYFQIPLPKDAVELDISYQVLFELEPQQINTLTIIRGQNRASFSFTREQETRRIRF